MTQTISVTGTDCFALAAQYLGDATEFYRIMAQNDLTDPLILGEPVQIVIPDVDDTPTGGVPTQ
jgi:hypothetical protein